jgi:hypothetical protein
MAYILIFVLMAAVFRWRTRCLNFQRKMPALEISKKEGITYRDYFPILRKQFLKQLPMEYSYVLSIHSGQRTCEEFAELSTTNFINYFFDYMKIAAGLEMTNEKQFIFTNYSRFSKYLLAATPGCGFTLSSATFYFLQMTLYSVISIPGYNDVLYRIIPLINSHVALFEAIKFIE